jgi:hypothetical protein
LIRIAKGKFIEGVKPKEKNIVDAFRRILDNHVLPLFE